MSRREHKNRGVYPACRHRWRVSTENRSRRRRRRPPQPGPAAAPAPAGRGAMLLKAPGVWPPLPPASALHPPAPCARLPCLSLACSVVFKLSPLHALPLGPLPHSDSLPNLTHSLPRGSLPRSIPPSFRVSPSRPSSVALSLPPTIPSTHSHPPLCPCLFITFSLPYCFLFMPVHLQGEFRG